jgi:hypothetical protein
MHWAVGSMGAGVGLDADEFLPLEFVPICQTEMKGEYC